MKKILLFSTIILIIFIIYLCNIDNKVYYLAVGDSLATGQALNKNTKGYPDIIKNYLQKKQILETYIDEFAQNGYRTTDLINDIENNKKQKIKNKEISLEHALIKADLVTISIGANDILNKINIEEPLDYNEIYNYIDDLTIDLDKLLKLIRQYCKEDIILVGYYNPYPYLDNKNTNKIFDYLNKKYKKISNKYNISYIEISDIFKENPNFLPNANDIHPSKEGYEAIAQEIIKTINKTLLKSWLLTKNSVTIWEQSISMANKFVMAEGEIEWKRTFIQSTWIQK